MTSVPLSAHIKEPGRAIGGPSKSHNGAQETKDIEGWYTFKCSCGRKFRAPSEGEGLDKWMRHVRERGGL